MLLIEVLAPLQPGDYVIAFGQRGKVISVNPREKTVYVDLGGSRTDLPINKVKPLSPVAQQKSRPSKYDELVRTKRKDLSRAFDYVRAGRTPAIVD